MGPKSVGKVRDPLWTVHVPGRYAGGPMTTPRLCSVTSRFLHSLFLCTKECASQVTAAGTLPSGENPDVLLGRQGATDFARPIPSSVEATSLHRKRNRAHQATAKSPLPSLWANAKVEGLQDSNNALNGPILPGPCSELTLWRCKAL